MSSIISSPPHRRLNIPTFDNNVKFTLRFPVTLSHVIGRRARAVSAQDFVLALSSYSYLLHPSLSLRDFNGSQYNLCSDSSHHTLSLGFTLLFTLHCTGCVRRAVKIAHVTW